MGDKITLKVDERQVHGKKVAKLRQEGLTPGVVYGPGIDPVAIQVPEGDLKKVVAAAGKHSPVHLTGKTRRIAMIKDTDIDPTKNSIRHVSFHAVRADQPVTAEVPIHLTGQGESEAEKAGLIILQTLDRIEVKALPMDLPDALEVSVLSLKEDGEKLTVADITLKEGVELVEHDSGHHEEDDEQHSITELQIASVWEPSALAAQNDKAAGDAEDESEVESENGSDDETNSAEETMPGGKLQDEPKQQNVDANK